MEYPPKVKSSGQVKITYQKYIIYHIENYLQEIYILQERMKRFLKFLSKKFRKKGQIQISSTLDRCLELFKEAVNNIVKIRGGHVHDRRYNDENLSALWLFDYVKENHPDLERAYCLSLFITTNEWLQRIERDNESLISIIDEIFKVVNKYVIEQ